MEACAVIAVTIGHACLGNAHSTLSAWLAHRALSGCSYIGWFLRICLMSLPELHRNRVLLTCVLPARWERGGGELQGDALTFLFFSSTPYRSLCPFLLRLVMEFSAETTEAQKRIMEKGRQRKRERERKTPVLSFCFLSIQRSTESLALCLSLSSAFCCCCCCCTSSCIYLHSTINSSFFLFYIQVDPIYYPIANVWTLDLLRLCFRIHLSILVKYSASGSMRLVIYNWLDRSSSIPVRTTTIPFLRAFL